VKTSIVIGSLVGLVLGASVAVAIDRGWIADIVGDTTSEIGAPTPTPSTVEPVPARSDAPDDDVRRPLRPGWMRYGMIDATASRTRQS
jgi:hypothetical protein